MQSSDSQVSPLLPRARFLRAIEGKRVDRPPVWIMRQAGRYLAEYRALRAEYSFIEIMTDPARAAEVTLQPIRRFGFDAAIIDPPRAGAEAQIAQLAQSGLPVIAHVSCNPVTFARDAALLVRHGYDLTHLRVVDQFRWSVHVELVAKFRKNAS